jgi:phosphoesterase RecJ-like protein
MRNDSYLQAQSLTTRLIESSSSVWLGTHIRPDGDAVGAMLGLALALEAQGRRVARLCAHPVPDYYAFLPGAALVAPAPPEWRAALGLVVDCDGLSRLGPLEPAFAALPHLVDIDHHAGRNAFGEAQLIDPEAASTSELVYELLRAMGAAITPDIATCLYAGILDDTGQFAHPNTTARVLRVAAALVERGADPAAIARKLYLERTAASVRLLGRALAGATLHHGGRVVSSTISLRDLEETGAKPADTEGIIDRLRTITGPRVAVLLTELEGGQVRVSLRSGGSPNVNGVAAAFGGGGHLAAAGCTLDGPLEEARRKVIAAVQAALEAGGQGPGARGQ